MKSICKRTLAFLLCALLLCGAQPFAASAAGRTSGTCGENLTWTYDASTDALTISGTGEMNSYDKWHDFDTGITYGCTPWMTYYDVMKTVVIESGVTSIGDNAFYGFTKLANITIPDSVTAIGYQSFSRTAYYNNSSNWQNSILYIDHCLVDAIPDITGVCEINFGTRCIADWAFGYAEEYPELTSIKIPESVIHIGYCAFDPCYALTSILVDQNNPVYHSAGNCLIETASKTILRGCMNSVIPDDGSVQIIGSFAFHGVGLIDITIPDSVVSIEEYAFYYCPGLISISFGSGVTSIGSCAFDACSGITSIVLPDSVTSIDSEAFSACTGLERIIIPDDIVKIGGSAFSGTPYYENDQNWKNDALYIGNHLIEVKKKGGGAYAISPGTRCIADYAFWNRTALTSVTIPDGVTSIGRCTFLDCTELTGVTIPDSVKRIDPCAFSGCIGITSVTVDANNPVYYAAGNCIIETETKTLMCGFNSTVIPDDGSVIRIGEAAFSGCDGLRSIVIPEGVTCIGDGAFNRCDDLTSVVIPSTVTHIGVKAFEGCYRLKSLTIPNGVRSVGEGAFLNSGLTSMHVPSSVTHLAQGVFYSFGFICSDTSDCCAKEYAERFGVEFRVCDGNHTQDTQPVQVEFDDDAFDVPVRLYVQEIARSELEHEFPQYEFSMTGAKAVYLICPVDENGNVVQPKAGHPVTLYVPVPALCNAEKCYISHVLDDQGHSESFKWNPKTGGRMKPFTVSADGKYFTLEVTSFSPFIVFEEQPVSLKLRDTKKTLPFGEKRTLIADVGNLPDGAKIVWTADSDRVELNPSADGRTCEVSAKKNGKVAVTATVLDVYGNPVEQDGGTVSASVALQTKAGFFHKLFYWFFRIPWPFG